MPIDTSLRVIARATAKPDHGLQAREIFSALVELTRQGPGCLSYQLLENEADPTDLVFVEQWASAEAEQAYFTIPHVLPALQRLVGLLVSEPQISRYRGVVK